MSDHEEISSDEEDLFDTTKSDVFLGFVDIGIGEDEEYPTIEDTFIGGQPIWPHPESKPEEKDLLCDNCGKLMALLLQAYAPLDGKAYDRIIYVFACKNTAQCSKKKGSVKAIRAVNKDPAIAQKIYEEQQEEAQKALDEKLRLENKRQFQIEMTKDLFDATKPSDKSGNSFASSENPFKSSQPFGSTNPFTSSTPFGEKKQEQPQKKEQPKKTNEKKSYAEASKAAKPAAKPVEQLSSGLPEYPGYILFTEKEQLKKVTLEPELEKYKHLIENSAEDEEGSSKGGKKERTLSSSSSSSAAVSTPTNQISKMLDDKYFENFTSVVNHNPTQVLRYDLGGQPVLYSGRDDVAKQILESTVPDPAYNPSSKRRFELQIMPKAIMDLEKGNESVADILNGMSWGTIIVYTDEEDYAPEVDEHHVAYVREYCGVQWEESVGRPEEAEQ